MIVGESCDTFGNDDSLQVGAVTKCFPCNFGYTLRNFEYGITPALRIGDQSFDCCIVKHTVPVAVIGISLFHMDGFQTGATEKGVSLMGYGFCRDDYVLEVITAVKRT